MAKVQIRVSSVIPASPNRIYGLWMDERHHSAVAGTRVRVDPWIGGRVSGWDGDIFASHLRLEIGRSITLAFRSVEYPEDAPDSLVQIEFFPAVGGTRVSITQNNVPPELKAAFKQHWQRNYLAPLKRFFESSETARQMIREATRLGYIDQRAERGASREPHQVFRSSPGDLLAASDEAAAASRKGASAKRKAAGGAPEATEANISRKQAALA